MVGAIAQLLSLIGAFGTTGGAYDLNGDGVVNLVDLAIALSKWF